VIEDLTQIFESLEVDDRSVIDKIHRKEEIYEGPMMDMAPDLVLMPGPGFDLKANIKADELSEKSIFTGTHNQTDAFLFVKEDFGISIPDNLSVFHIIKMMGGLRETS